MNWHKNGGDLAMCAEGLAPTAAGASVFEERIKEKPTESAGKAGASKAPMENMTADETVRGEGCFCSELPLGTRILAQRASVDCDGVEIRYLLLACDGADRAAFGTACDRYYSIRIICASKTVYLPDIARCEEEGYAIFERFATCSVAPDMAAELLDALLL